MKSEKRIFLSFILNFAFTIFEFIGGLITNSVALLSDSIHDLGDSISMGIAIVLEKKSKKKPDYDFTYGYRRYSLIGALISSMILLAGSAIIIFEAINRLLHPETINSELVIYFAIVGVVVNGLAALNLKKGKTINEKVISLHLLEDVLGWVALLIAAIVMYYTEIVILDALLSLVFTLYIIYHVMKNLKKIFKVFLEATPKNMDVASILAHLEKVEHVLEVHHVHLWSLEGNVPLITFHATLEDDLDSKQVSQVQNQMNIILKDLGITHSTIQIEFSDFNCMDEDCTNQETLNKGHNHNH